MESLNDIKKRIKSVKNTRQITKAMEVVSATKMRKSQERALKARGYAFTAFELLANLDRYEGRVVKPALFVRPKTGTRTLFIVITSDKGLAGSLNSNVLKKALAYYKTQQEKGIDVVVAGKKARDFFRFRGVSIKKEFFGHSDFADFNEAKELTDFVKEAFLAGEYRKVVALYTNFKSTLKQEVSLREILPLSEPSLKEMIEGLTPEKGRYAQEKGERVKVQEYMFEPSPQEVFDELSDRLFQMLIYHIILEANASEHSARMVAMKTASENAQEIVDGLTLEFNKGRQAKITQELVEITSGSDAVA